VCVCVRVRGVLCAVCVCVWVLCVFCVCCACCVCVCVWGGVRAGIPPHLLDLTPLGSTLWSSMKNVVFLVFGLHEPCSKREYALQDFDRTGHLWYLVYYRTEA
jgi:hypothetical protein